MARCAQFKFRILKYFSSTKSAGRAGEECAKADGRELWILGDMYQVEKIHDWLLDKCIDWGNIGAACEFGLTDEGSGESMSNATIEHGWIDVATARQNYEAVNKNGLRGVRRETATILVNAILTSDGRLPWQPAKGAARVLRAWMRANGGGRRKKDLSWFRQWMADLGPEMLKMPLQELRNFVEGCRYVDAEWAAEMVGKKLLAGDTAYELDYGEVRRYRLRPPKCTMGDRRAKRIALHGKGLDRRMAVTYDDCVAIVRVESGAHIATAGRQGSGAGEFSEHGNLGIAFSDSGELYVSDERMHRIQVFDRQGRYLRGFGKKGRGNGRFRYPEGICFTADGNLAVADTGNARVQILRPDGTFLRAIRRRNPAANDNDYVDDEPCQVCAGADGTLCVFDNCSDEIQVYDCGGSFIRCIDVDKVDNEHGWRGNQMYIASLNDERRCHVLAVGGGGEILIRHREEKRLMVLDREGRSIQVVDEFSKGRIQSVAADADGRLFVLDAHWPHGSVVVLC